MSVANQNKRKTNAHRLLVGLGGIGYSPHEAICDIADNAVSAGAKNVYIKINKINANANDNRRNNVSEYLIIDDGRGMSLEQIGNALDLGSSEEFYQEGTLSKFGLGLKSAAFANGDRLEVVSGIDGTFNKECVDLSLIEDDYFSISEELSSEDKELIERYLPSGTGTIVRVAKIRNTEHPSVKDVVRELEEKLGVIYYYFITDDGLNIYLLNDTNDTENEPEPIPPFDPLFSDEIVDDAKLDEREWSGRDVRWLMMPKTVVLDSVNGENIQAEIEITQLPHPPSFKFDNPNAHTQVRDRYKIAAKNYGFYIYRNKRLISWADKLKGIVPQDQDYYAFRGRINVDESADEVFNINVSKNTVSLSANAEKVLEDELALYKRKSKLAWNSAKRIVAEKTKENSTEKANELARATSDVDAIFVAGNNSTQNEVAEARGEEMRKRDLEDAKKEAADSLSREQDRPVRPEDVNDEAARQYIRGDEGWQEDACIFESPFLPPDNFLWEPYVDADPSKSDCVRISQSHRFSTLVNIDNGEDFDMQVIMRLLFLDLARAEINTIKYCQQYDSEVVRAVLEEFRRNASALLTQTCRQLDGKLPPY